MKSLPAPYRYAGAAVLMLACLWVCIDARSCVGQHTVETSTQQANQHHEQAVIHAAQGEAHDAENERLAAEVAKLKARLAKLQAAQPVHVPPVAVPPAVVAGPDVSGDGGTQIPGPDPRVPVLLELVEAQDKQIKVLTLDRNDWREAYRHSAQVEVQLRSALAAKEGVAKAQRWLGRIEGFAVGFGSGYAIGGIK